MDSIFRSRLYISSMERANAVTIGATASPILSDNTLDKYRIDVLYSIFSNKKRVVHAFVILILIT